MKRQSKFGFTLMELLIVVAVVSLLAALLVPAVQRGITVSQTGKCVGNLRAIGSGLQAYIADHGGDLPPCAALPNSGYKISFRQRTFWFDALNPYMGHPDYAANRLQQFPAPDSVGTEFPFPWQLCPAKKVEPLQRQSVGYGWNHTNFGYNLSAELNNPGGQGFGTRITQVAQPSRTIIIGDSKDADFEPAHQHQHRYINDYDRDNQSVYPKRHGGGGNYLFLDGHVEWFSDEQMKTPEVTILFKRNK